MDKSILNDYIDACELIRETEADIRKLQKRKKEVLQDSVRGSNPEFPYNPQSFKVSGTGFDVAADNELRQQEEMLKKRKRAAREIKMQVDDWMLAVPVRMQRIIRWKFFEGLSWEETAKKMGRKATADGMRMEFRNFMNKE